MIDSCQQFLVLITPVLELQLLIQPFFKLIITLVKNSRSL